MKRDEVQSRCPCVTSNDIDLMKCDGMTSNQDLVFDAMTTLEHPDDIYEIYITQLDAERKRRNQIRRFTVSATFL